MKDKLVRVTVVLLVIAGWCILIGAVLSFVSLFFVSCPPDLGLAFLGAAFCFALFAGSSLVTVLAMEMLSW